MPPSIMVWRSVRAGEDTKTKRSRRTLALPQRCVDVLREHRTRQDALKRQASSRWQDNDLVFPSRVGTPWDASHVRREFRKVVEAAGLDPSAWTPRELRHSFVSLMSDAGVPVEHIARLVGHSGTTTTEAVYRKQIRPVLIEGADAMDRIFPAVIDEIRRGPDQRSLLPMPTNDSPAAFGSTVHGFVCARQNCIGLERRPHRSETVGIVAASITSELASRDFAALRPPRLPPTWSQSGWPPPRVVCRSASLSHWSKDSLADLAPPPGDSPGQVQAVVGLENWWPYPAMFTVSAGRILERSGLKV